MEGFTVGGVSLLRDSSFFVVMIFFYHFTI